MEHIHHPQRKQSDSFPDGTLIDAWFYDARKPALKDLGKSYDIREYGIVDDGRLYTDRFQRLIDLVSDQGGGVIVIPAGTYLTGSIFFKQGVNLYLSEGATLKGSADAIDYEIRETRMEGETCLYFTALINADGIDGFQIAGPGTIDGNGLKAWKSFWLRRKWNPNCTNKDEQRPRLLYLSNCSNVTISDVRLINSHYWTTHIYRCDHVKYLDVLIYSPHAPVKAPSTDAIDIDVCTDILIKGCYMEVDDDSVVLKGGKGPWADALPENGSNERIIVEDCTYGFCHGCLTCGSESIHNRNIILRRIKVLQGNNLLWLKMRPDTPQLYEYIQIENVTGSFRSFIDVHEWKQFFDLKGRTDMPVSVASHITIQNCECTSDICFELHNNPEVFLLSDFHLENLQIKTRRYGFDPNMIRNLVMDHVEIQAEIPMETD